MARLPSEWHQCPRCGETRAKPFRRHLHHGTGELCIGAPVPVSEVDAKRLEEAEDHYLEEAARARRRNGHRRR